MTTAIIETEHLSFAYNDQPVLKNVNLQIREGDFVALIGPNGGGKTTLIKLILGLLEADGGTVRVFGLPPKDARHRLGYVPQDIHVNRNFPVSALDVVLMGRLKPGGKWSRYTRADRETAMQTLARLEMDLYAHRRIQELSGGQRQRVFIARALVSEPELLLLDEPTSNIDASGQTEFYALIKDLNREVTILMVSHDLMIMSSYVKSVACVNREVHHHEQAEITEEMLSLYHCPVELIAHGLPHRVLRKH